MTSVRLAQPDDRTHALDVITDAFAPDPVVRWLFPDDATYPARAAAFFGFLYDVRVAVDGAWMTAGAESFALWSPPGPAAGEWEERAWDQVAAELARFEIERCDAWDAAVAPHHPDAPHWYLGVLATAPDHQGQGYGPAAAQPGLDAAARAGLPAFLETGVDDNRKLYERMGFTVTGVIDTPDLPFGWCMRRDPR